MTIVVKKMDEIIPHENNPRKNEEAVEAVAESIRQCGYIAPIIVDEDGIILAGHTRYKALQKLGRSECQVVVAANLSEEQKQKYRLLDNKTAELSGWDFALLEEELNGLDFDGFDFGFDILDSQQLDIDALFQDNTQTKKEEKKIQCPHCGEWFVP